jgi:signal transduction histidine kinase
VIFLSALQESSEIATGLDSGGVDYISKPFRKPELLARVRTHLQLSHSRKQLREQNLLLERLAREAREASQARDKFVAILAHDLRNPFSGILSLVTELEFNLDQFSPEELREAIQSVYNSTSQVSDLLHSLLEWAQTQTGAQVIYSSKHSVGDLLDQALRPLAGMIVKKELKVTKSIDGCEVWADENTLLAVFRNLLSNAIKFTPRGGSIRVEGLTKGASTEVSFRDSGVGISAQTISELFRLDIRTTTAGTESESGSGLGLLLCKEFIERNGGSLDVESQLGKGSLFRVTLPTSAANL